MTASHLLVGQYSPHALSHPRYPPLSPPPFPIPPLPPCPVGFSNHSSGYWQSPHLVGAGMTVAQCGAACAAEKGCAAFEVYDPARVTEPSSAGGSSCYTFSKLDASFKADKRGLIRTCVRS